MKILIIQTAFIGDVVLATPLIETIKASHSDSEIDFLLRKGNEQLLEEHPLVRSVLIMDKKVNRIAELFRLTRKIRNAAYDRVIVVQRFASAGLIGAFSGAKWKSGFSKNPMSFAFHKAVAHKIEDGIHEVDRNLQLITTFCSEIRRKPKLYPNHDHLQKVETNKPYVCLAPASIWFTKQFPIHKWEPLIEALSEHQDVYLLGGSADQKLCEDLASKDRNRIKNMAGKLTFLESTALISKAQMTYTNDSAVMHFASAVNAPVTAIYCSTVPGFGFGPLSDQSTIVETSENLSCRPCGLHGKKACPEGHFKCSEIAIEQITKAQSFP